MSGYINKVSTADVLAALVGANVPVASIQLGDTSAVTLPEGSLGGDGDGGAVIHDGETEGGIPLMKDVPLPPQHAFIAVDSLGVLATASAFIKFGEIALTADQAVDGTEIDIGVDIDIALISTLNLTDLAFNVRAAGQNPGDSTHWPAPATPASDNKAHSWHGNASVTLGVSVGANLSVSGADPIVVCNYPTTAGAPVTKSTAGVFDFATDPLVSGVAAVLELGVWIKTSNPALAGVIQGKVKWVYAITTP